MKILKGQFWHFLFLSALLIGVLFLKQQDPSIAEGGLFGYSTNIWFYVAIICPIVHQIYVVLLWRLELHYKWLSGTFGRNGFLLFKIGFAVLFLSRPLSITLLAFSNLNTFIVDPVFSYLISGVLLFPGVYLFYSVKRYFGIDRAFGMDHFYPEKAKELPMIDQGIFKYTPNAMYVFGFLILWIPGILLQSKSALLVALFSHLYIWVHYYFTEKPDMNYIYD